MRKNTKSLAVMLLLGCTTAHKNNRNNQKISSQFSENYDEQNMLQLYQNMAQFDFGNDVEHEYNDTDILDFVQVETNNGQVGGKKVAIQPKNEAAIINQLKKQTLAEVQQEQEREKQIQQEEAAFAQPFIELGQQTQEYDQKQHQKKKEIKNLLKQAAGGKVVDDIASKEKAKPAVNAPKVENKQNQIKLFQEDNVINDKQEDKYEKSTKDLSQQQPKVAKAPQPVVPKNSTAAAVAPASKQINANVKKVAVVPKNSLPIKKNTIVAPKVSEAVPSITNTNDLFEQSQKLLSATENLDNGKQIILPKPLSNPKKIAQDIIRKKQMEMMAAAQKQTQQESEKDEFSQNLYEMSKQLLNSANEIEKETDKENAIRMQKEAEQQAIAQKSIQKQLDAEKALKEEAEMKLQFQRESEKLIKKQQKKEQKDKERRELEKLSKQFKVTKTLTQASQPQKVVAVVNKAKAVAAPVPQKKVEVVKIEEKKPEPVQKVQKKKKHREVSSTDPEIMKAAEAMADKIIENERLMKEKEEENRPKSVLEEVGKMVDKRAVEVEKGPEQLKKEADEKKQKEQKFEQDKQLRLAQEKKQQEDAAVTFTPIQPSLMDQMFTHHHLDLSVDQKKEMAKAEQRSHSFLDRLNQVQNTPMISLSTITVNPFDTLQQKSQSDEQVMHNQMIKMQDDSLNMFATDINV